MDVTDEEDVKAGAKHIDSTDGKLDVLVNKFVYPYRHFNSPTPCTNTFTVLE